MIEGTEFDFLLDKDGVLYKDLGSIALQTVLDRRYYAALWKALVSLSKKDRFAAGKILSEEISLRNSGWALRLRTYYGMEPDEVKPHLIVIPGSRSLAEEALRCLEYPLDSYSPWASWRWKEFLNPGQGGEWQAEPRYFQNAASRYLYGSARHHFRLNPFSLDTVFCFVKLKQFEEDLLTSEAEGLGMGMPARDIVSVLGIDA
jgi:vacuolar-type H+-ATPase subunit C/Vma6